MFEMVKAIHEALGIESTWAFVLVIASVFAFLSGGVAWVVDKGYKKSVQERAGYTQSVTAPEKHNTAAGSIAQTPSPIAPPAKPLTEVEKQKIVETIIERYRKKHNGQSPDATYINDRLRKQGQTFSMSFRQQRSHPKWEISDNTIVGAEEGIHNEDPNVEFNIHDNQFIDTERAIVNVPPGTKPPSTQWPKQPKP
ncbi:MAG: hypothetical protein ABSG52_15900 [Terriglobales bacterium]|jgi:hypothetical protein